MRVGSGAQAEVVASLAIIMISATALLTVFFFSTQARQLESLQGLLGKALAAEANSPIFAVGGASPGVDWWTISAAGRAAARSAGAGPIDETSLSLAVEARSNTSAIIRSGSPWDPIRFVVPIRSSEEVAVARIPAAVSRGSVFALLAVDSLVFIAFGVYLLRRRVVVPMLELAAAAREIGEAGPGTRVVVDGVVEVQEVACSLNDMSEALEQRSSALEKAVGELRESNAHLRQARVGLARAERLAAVGGLAAGVAHEVGNPMGAMLAFMSLAERDSEISDDGRCHLKRAAEQGARVREILRQLLDFSRPPQARATPVDLLRVAAQVQTLIGAQRQYMEIDFEVRSIEGLLPVQSDESMLSQILLNLVINSADAISGAEVNDRKIRLTLRPTQMERRSVDEPGTTPKRRATDAMACVVEDSGPGIDEDVRDLIFDPFFTTKPPGEGTGLGLANALKLVEELGGVIECLPGSELGGAAFELRLPTAYQKDAAGSGGVRLR